MKYLLLIVTLLFFGLLLICYPGLFTAAALIVGGGNSSTSPFSIDLSRSLVIPDHSTLVFDGNNLVHSIGSVRGESDFNSKLERLSDAVSKMKYDTHIVLKNRPKHSSDFFTELKSISKKYPKITYHVAYDQSDQESLATTKETHHLKARDDFLLSYVCTQTSGYLVSFDKFRDFKLFKGIAPFTHYVYKAGHVKVHEKINPATVVIGKPYAGNHITPRIGETGAGVIFVDHGRSYLRINL